MAEFDDTQIEAYIKNWFDSTPDQYRRQLDKEMETAKQCWKTLNAQEHRATKELARNPLLLTLLCMVYDISQSFSRNRASLYENALNIFLKEWAAEKRVNQGASIDQYLDIPDEIRMLSEIAEKNFKADRLFLVNPNSLHRFKNSGQEMQIRGKRSMPPKSWRRSLLIRGFSSNKSEVPILSLT